MYRLALIHPGQPFRDIEMLTRAESVLSILPAIMLRPVNAYGPLAFDLVPNGPNNLSNFRTWCDFCDQDIKTDGAQAFVSATLGITTTRTVVGSRSFNGATDKPLDFLLGSSSTAFMRYDGTDLMVGKTTSNISSVGVEMQTGTGRVFITRSAAVPLTVNREGGDGGVVSIATGGTTQGSISVSGATTSYGAFCGTHWAQLADGSKPDIPRGTVVETIDEMCQWLGIRYTDHAGVERFHEVQWPNLKLGQEVDYEYDWTEEPSEEAWAAARAIDPKALLDPVSHTNKVTATVDVLQNDQLPRFKISDTPGTRSVYGVFMNWSADQIATNDANIASLGAFIIRIAKGVTVTNGDYLESNGDGCARVQADDLMCSSTIAKVTSTTVIETYPDGSYLVPCTLHCG